MAKKLTVNIVNAQGTVLVSAHKIHARDGKIALDGNLMGTMPGQFYIHPIDVYKATKLLNFEIVKEVVGMWFAGRKEFKAAEQAEQAKAEAAAAKPATA